MERPPKRNVNYNSLKCFAQCISKYDNWPRNINKVSFKNWINVNECILDIIKTLRFKSEFRMFQPERYLHVLKCLKSKLKYKKCHSTPIVMRAKEYLDVIEQYGTYLSVQVLVGTWPFHSSEHRTSEEILMIWDTGWTESIVWSQNSGWNVK